MPAVDVVGLFRKGREKEQEERAWQLWSAIYPMFYLPENGFVPGMKFMPFSEFYRKQVSPEKISRRPAEKIVAEAQKIRRNLGKEW